MLRLKSKHRKWETRIPVVHPTFAQSRATEHLGEHEGIALRPYKVHY